MSMRAMSMKTTIRGNAIFEQRREVDPFVLGRVAVSASCGSLRDSSLLFRF